MKLAEELREISRKRNLLLEANKKITEITSKLRAKAEFGERNLIVDMTKYKDSVLMEVHDHFVREGFRTNCYLSVGKSTINLSW